jgi:hypothetical protein
MSQAENILFNALITIADSGTAIIGPFTECLYSDLHGQAMDITRAIVRKAIYEANREIGLE